MVTSILSGNLIHLGEEELSRRLTEFGQMLDGKLKISKNISGLTCPPFLVQS
jgi:hypothetical protein